MGVAVAGVHLQGLGQVGLGLPEASQAEFGLALPGQDPRGVVLPQERGAEVGHGALQVALDHARAASPGPGEREGRLETDRGVEIGERLRPAAELSEHAPAQQAGVDRAAVGPHGPREAGQGGREIPPAHEQVALPGQRLGVARLVLDDALELRVGVGEALGVVLPDELGIVPPRDVEIREGLAKPAELSIRVHAFVPAPGGGGRLQAQGDAQVLGGLAGAAERPADGPAPRVGQLVVGAKPDRAVEGLRGLVDLSHASQLLSAPGPDPAAVRIEGDGCLDRALGAGEIAHRGLAAGEVGPGPGAVRRELDRLQEVGESGRVLVELRPAPPVRAVHVGPVGLRVARDEAARHVDVFPGVQAVLVDAQRDEQGSDHLVEAHGLEGGFEAALPVARPEAVEGAQAVPPFDGRIELQRPVEGAQGRRGAASRVLDQRGHEVGEGLPRQEVRRGGRLVGGAAVLRPREEVDRAPRAPRPVAGLEGAGAVERGRAAAARLPVQRMRARGRVLAAQDGGELARGGRSLAEQAQQAGAPRPVLPRRLGELPAEVLLVKDSVARRLESGAAAEVVLPPEGLDEARVGLGG